MINKKKFWNVKIDFQFITILITFFCYGLFGAISKNHNIIFSILTISIIILFYFYYKFNNYFFKFKFYYSDFYFLLFFFVIFFILNYNDLNTSLYGDELADAKAAARTPIYSSLIFLNLIENDLLKNIPLKKIIYLLQFFQVIFFFFITIFFYKKRNLITLLLIIFFTVFFRLFLKEYGMHPPLQHFFNFLFTGFFGIHEFVIRLSYIFVYSLGCLIFFKQVCGKNNVIRSAIITLFLFTIPISLLSSSSVNNSLWAFCFFSNFLVYFYFTKKIDYRFLILLVSIFTLTRITIFFAIIPILILLFFHIIENFLKKKKIEIKRYINFFIPTLLFLPFLIKTFLLGSIVHGETLNFHQIFYSLKYSYFNFILLKSILINVSIYISVFILFIFFPLKNYLLPKKIAVLLFFLSLVFIFSTISKAYIGNPRYNLEYFLPFCLLGFLIILKNFNSTKIKNFFFILILIGLFLNIYEIKSYPQKKLLNIYKNDEKKIYNNFLRERYNYREAYDYILKNDYQNQTYFVGVYYGIISEILNDYSYNQILSIQSLNQNQKKINKIQNLNFFQKINLNKELISILISNTEDANSKVTMLLDNGWVLNKVFINKTYKSKIYHLIKKSKN